MKLQELKKERRRTYEGHQDLGPPPPSLAASGASECRPEQQPGHHDMKCKNWGQPRKKKMRTLFSGAVNDTFLAFSV